MSASLTDIPAPPAPAIARYSRRPFPAYRFVPGLHPHPTRDAGGHSYAAQLRSHRHPPWRVEEWRSLDDWLYGVDLFNGFYFWEAHEAWEGLWAAVERDTPPSLLLQGLIQIAAALLKTHMGVLSGARVLSSEGIDKVERAARSGPQLLGLELPTVAAAFRTYFAPTQMEQLPSIGPGVPILRLEDPRR